MVDDAPRVLAQGCGASPDRRRLGVRVAVRRQDLLADEVFDEAERPPGRGGVGVHDAARPERTVENRVVADRVVTDPLDQALGVG